MIKIRISNSGYQAGSRGLKWFWHKNLCARSGPRSGEVWLAVAGQCRGPMRLQWETPPPHSRPSTTFSRFGFKQFPAQHGLSTVRSGACIFLMKKFLLVRIMRRRMSSKPISRSNNHYGLHYQVFLWSLFQFTVTINQDIILLIVKLKFSSWLPSTIVFSSRWNLYW